MCYKQLCLARVVESRLEETRLRKHLEFWQVVPHSDTTNKTTKVKVKLLEDQLQSLAYRREDGCII